MGSLSPPHASQLAHESLMQDCVMHFYNGPSLKSTFSDKNTLNFYEIFRDFFFFLDEFSAGSQNLAYCTKQ